MTAEIFAPDRDEFYFTTGTREDGFDIWIADRTETGWGEEQYLGPVVNSENYEGDIFWVDAKVIQALRND